MREKDDHEGKNFPFISIHCRTTEPLREFAIQLSKTMYRPRIYLLEDPSPEFYNSFNISLKKPNKTLISNNYTKRTNNNKKESYGSLQ